MFQFMQLQQPRIVLELLLLLLELLATPSEMVSSIIVNASDMVEATIEGEALIIFIATFPAYTNSSTITINTPPTCAIR